LFSYEKQREDVMTQNIQDSHQAHLARLREAKLEMKYAVLKLSKRRFAIVEYGGASYWGDWQQQNGFYQHTVEFVPGCENLSYVEMKDKILELCKKEEHEHAGS
jgi:hypothetical protein